ncbi:hypothetical protein HYZ78_03605 [Candidatus Microgenomates bacterium]|nr:hypothetical protein [Candidatus Microgenomates bacterium]
MSKDKVTLKGNGYMAQWVLHSGGAKTFVLLVAVIGAVCIIFSFITRSLLPFVFWVVITTGITGLLAKLALSPNGWAFFLESNLLFQVIKLQMELIGDKQIGRAQIEDAKFVQPILETPGDIETETKTDHRKVLAERKQ